MIFSFSDSSFQKISFELDQTDIFCFFGSENTVKVAADLWLLAVAASLKIKKNVLILEKSLPHAPMINLAQRWQIEDQFLWLAPRSLSVLLEAHHTISVNYETIKSYLEKIK